MHHFFLHPSYKRGPKLARVTFFIYWVFGIHWNDSKIAEKNRVRVNRVRVNRVRKSRARKGTLRYEYPGKKDPGKKDPGKKDPGQQRLAYLATLVPE